MKTFSFIGLGLLLVSPILALPTEQTEHMNELEKRDGHINVKTWSGSNCDVHGQGQTAVGTGGKCINMSNAGSVHIGGPSSINPGGCSYVHFEYYHNTDCNTPTNQGIKYGPHSCINPLYASAFAKCVG